MMERAYGWLLTSSLMRSEAGCLDLPAAARRWLVAVEKRVTSCEERFEKYISFESQAATLSVEAIGLKRKESLKVRLEDPPW